MSHNGMFGYSKVASSWKEAYYKAQKGDRFSVVTSIAGEPDDVIDLGDAKICIYENQEWKGIARGGTITRRMTYVVKNGVIFSKSQKNIDAFAG